MESPRTVAKSRAFVIAGFVAAGLGISNPASAQNVQDLKTYSPLVLNSRGSFYVGGETVYSDNLWPSSPPLTGEHRINQMYVDYMIPVSRNKVPVVFVHGGGLSGKTWGTTPDGRMGWDEYFVRKGYPTYVVDQVGRGRSGFDHTNTNKVWQGLLPPKSMFAFFTLGYSLRWEAFRVGPEYGTPFSNTKFPYKYFAQLDDSAVPDNTIPTIVMPADSPTVNNLATLGESLKGAVLIGHSQGGRAPLDAALANPGAVAGAVVTEPGGCRAASVDAQLPSPDPIYTNKEISKLARTTPVLVLFGDTLGNEDWKARLDDCKKLVRRLKDAGGNATMLYLPNQGVLGNSHMFMIDENNRQVADLLMKWIKANVRKRSADLAQKGQE